MDTSSLSRTVFEIFQSFQGLTLTFDFCAFDKVSHDKLVLKMRRMGLEDEIVRWINKLVVG